MLRPPALVTSMVALAAIACARFIDLEGVEYSPASGDGGNASRDGGDGRDATGPTGPYCESVASNSTYCMDFDAKSLDDYDDTDELERYPDKDRGGAIFLDTENRISSPASVRCTMPGQNAGSSAVWVAHSVFGLKQELRFEFDIRVNALPSSEQESMHLATLTIGDGDDKVRSRLRIGAREGVTDFVQVSPYPSDGGGRTESPRPFAQPLRRGTWTHVDVHVAYLTNTIEVSLRAQDAPAPTKVISTSLEASQRRSGEIFAQVGIVYSSTPHPPLDVQFDNIRFQTQ